MRTGRVGLPDGFLCEKERMASSGVSPASRPPRSGVRSVLTRREVLRRGAAGSLVLAVGGVLEACGSGGAVRAAPSSRFEPSGGTEIPSVDVRFAMWPFGDTAIGFVGLEQGFFADVGITVVPHGGETRLAAQTPGELLSGQLDVASGYMPIQVQTFPRQPDIKMIQLHDVYVGAYLLASPSSRAKTYDDFARAGEPFRQAAKSAVLQLAGKRVALSTLGNNRSFFSTLLGFAGLAPNNLDLTVVDDTKILQLARAGTVDFAMVSGAAQSVELIDEGFFRVFGIGQLLDNLRPGDPRAVTSLGHAGIVSTDTYIARHTETLLRFMSVYYRIIDQLRSDPDTALAIVLPHLNAATGLALSLRDCKVVFSRFYDFISFEQTADHLLNRRYPTQLDNVYAPQIDAARAGGIYRPTDHVTPEDIFVGTRLYRILSDLRKRYEELKGSHSPRAGLAIKAEEQYRNRNYLDAYRLLKAGQGRASA
jgi:ABC-type nitrate/sulfonate/bicarbonate transport system substrate-binding protein